jgi:hypothetical protein
MMFSLAFSYISVTFKSAFWLHLSMGSGHVLSIGRAFALVSMVFALVGVALSFQGYATEEFSLENADVSSHTKAFCSPKEGMLYCEDRLIVEYGDAEHVSLNSPITGNAFIETTETL